MTKIEDTLRRAVATVESFVACSIERGVSPETFTALPTKAELDALVAWVTAALPVVEAVREWQVASKPKAKDQSGADWATRYTKARFVVMNVACPVSK